ncbi:MAG: chromosomal replication initiator protein DnaA [Clostridia bacterium]|nr:chromosomal replication initiator protein DnaA [Clostridia bacterium]
MNDLQYIVDMMMPSLESKFNAAPSTFKLWFGDFLLISLTEKEAVFSTPTELRKRILISKYMDIITESLSELLGFNINVKIVSREELAAIGKEPDPLNLTPTKEEALENEEREKKIKALLDDTSKSDGDEKKNILDEYTFDNFIEGASNKFAKAACYAVANTPATDFNPLFIHGNSGLGKTHLLCAVINHMKIKYPKLKIVYKKCEDFMNELISAISNYSTQEFKEKYRGADVLLIDDIQFIAGKVSTQEEFFHTFSYLYESNKQIILTSDRPPHEIKPLEDRLRTRFEGGLIADIQPPSPELRAAIIKKKSQSIGLEISNDLVEYMASRLHENIRQIEGVIKKLGAINAMTGREVTKEAIDEVISVIDPGNIPMDILIDKIIATVGKYYGVTVDEIKSKKKTDAVANARHIAIYIIRKLTDKSFKEIGNIFSRDHSTVMASCDRVNTNIKTMIKTDSDIKKIIKDVKGN